MNYLKTNTIGIDSAIQRVQVLLYDTLIGDWVDKIDGYGRVYKNPNKLGGFVPEFYRAKNEYIQSFYNDNMAVTFFFVDSDDSPSEDENVFTNDVKCIFMVNLAKIFPTDVERSDVEAQRDVVSLLQQNAFGEYIITGVNKGIENIMSEFGTERIKFSDIHPYHSFAVTLNLSYYITEKCE